MSGIGALCLSRRLSGGRLSDRTAAAWHGSGSASSYPFPAIAVGTDRRGGDEQDPAGLHSESGAHPT